MRAGGKVKTALGNAVVYVQNVLSSTTEPSELPADAGEVYCRTIAKYVFLAGAVREPPFYLNLTTPETDIFQEAKVIH